MASEYKYGSVSNDEEVGGDKSFDETDLYYMKDGERTTKEKVINAIKLGVPIIIGSILFVALGYLLFHNFGYFYPGSGGRSSSNNSSVTTVSSTPATSSHSSHYTNIATKVPITTTTTTSFGASSCAANPKCDDLGLTGECCPTSGGIKLSCCD